MKQLDLMHYEITEMDRIYSEILNKNDAIIQKQQKQIDKLRLAVSECMLSRNQQQKLLKDSSQDGEEPAAAGGNEEQADTPEARTDVLASRISELRSCLEDLGDMVSPDTSAPLDEASESRADDLRSRISDLRCDLEDLDDVLRLDDSDSFLETMEVRISELGSRITELRSDLGDICDMSASDAESSETRFLQQGGKHPQPKSYAARAFSLNGCRKGA
jgi:hypothetical protein